jgi:tetratricopeptide (TPR) repeat protein
VVEERSGRDFFVSYTGVNEPWARWICVQLERAGYSTVSQALDFRPGHDFVREMQVAVSTAARTIAVLSPAYVGSRFGEAEWRAAFAADPSGERGLLVPVRVQPCRPPALLATRVYVDLVDVDEVSARERLLAAVGPPAAHPTDAPYPGGPQSIAGAEGAAGADARVRFPGAGAWLSNLPARNRHFSGRDALLDGLHARVQEAVVTAVLPVEAVHGLGGVGKTELVLEFGHRFAGDYDITWWVPAEQPTTAAAALAALAGKLGVPATGDQAATVAGLFELLRGRDRWLLIYDNAENPADLIGLLPAAGTGSVLVTSRWSAWGRRAEPLRLDVLAREESVRFLTGRTGRTDADGLGQLAALVGDLPLALEEAAAYLEQTGIGLSEYVGLLRARAAELFGLGSDATTLGSGGAEGDQRRVATVWSVSLERVTAAAPAAAELLQLLAFLASAIPRDLLPAQSTVVGESLPGSSLGTVVADPVGYNNTLGVAGHYSLVELTPQEIGVHRLVQAVMRARLDADRERQVAACVVGILRAAFPNQSWETTTWGECERLLPQVLAVCEHAERLAVAGDQAGWLLDRASSYLRGRGQYSQALPLAQRAVVMTEAALGADHVEALRRRDVLAGVLAELGDYAAARAQSEQIVQIGEQALGPDHPDVAIWRDNLGLVLRALGDLAGARTQFERGLQISEQALGPDHPDIGKHRGHLGNVLQELGDLAGARTQLERALQISEQALGPDHKQTRTIRARLDGLSSQR